MKFLLYKWILPSADHIVLQSDQMKRDVTRQGIHEDKITPILMGIDKDRIPFIGYNSIDYSSKDKKVILYLGTLNKIRRIDFLLYVLSCLLKIDPNIFMYLVGSWSKAYPAVSLLVSEVTSVLSRLRSKPLKLIYHSSGTGSSARRPSQSTFSTHWFVAVWPDRSKSHTRIPVGGPPE